LERRRKSEAPDTRGSVNEEATSNHQTSSLSELAYIEETIARGAITIGVVPPLKECVAIAHEGRHTLAMLKRQKGESLTELLSPKTFSPTKLIPQTRNIPERLRCCPSRVPQAVLLPECVVNFTQVLHGHRT
jgi:hypothetical protein